jgi:hypothetical protein
VAQADAIIATVLPPYMPPGSDDVLTVPSPSHPGALPVGLGVAAAAVAVMIVVIGIVQRRRARVTGAAGKTSGSGGAAGKGDSGTGAAPGTGAGRKKATGYDRVAASSVTSDSEPDSPAVAGLGTHTQNPLRTAGTAL